MSNDVKDEEISYNDLWLTLKKDLTNELLDWGDLDCPYTVSLRDFLAKMEEMEAKNKCQ